MIFGGTIVLFAQEVLEVGPFLFTVLFFGGAIGGLVGGNIAPVMSHRLGSGTSLAVTLGGSAIGPSSSACFPWWPVVIVIVRYRSVARESLWNVITVSLRQTIIPPHLLGPRQQRVPILRLGHDADRRGAGGALVWIVERTFDRDLALRSTWFAAAAVYPGCSSSAARSSRPTRSKPQERRRRRTLRPDDDQRS